MKVELPALSLALQRSSLGIKRSEDHRSGAVLLAGIQGLLRASMHTPGRLSAATCPCEGDLLVAVEADRLRKLLEACTSESVELECSGGDLKFKAGGVKATLRGYDLETLPRHDKPKVTDRVQLSAELVNRIRFVGKLTADRGSYNYQPAEKVVSLRIADGAATAFGRFGGFLAAWAAAELEGPPSSVGINRSLVALMGPGPQGLAWSETMIGFETEDYETFETRIEVAPEFHEKLLASCPDPATSLDAKSLLGAIEGATSVHSTGTDQVVFLRAGNGVVEVTCRSHAGDFTAEVQLTGEGSFHGKYNAELLGKISGSLKTPKVGTADTVLWFSEGPLKIALAGIFQ